MINITLVGEPKSSQTCYKYTCRGSFVSGYMDKKCKDIKEDYQWQAKSQYHGEPLTGRLKIAVTLFFSKKGKRDWDNFHKLSMDALSDIVWEDDELIDEAVVYKKFDKEHPRIEIEIYEKGETRD
jgi:Holliday junction resolvase RusA-like endonuclease